jgi:hypothetical protein
MSGTTYSQTLAISPGLYGVGTGLVEDAAGLTVTSAAVNGTTVALNGSPVTLDGSYLEFTVDSAGDLSIQAYPDNQTVINEINANSSGSELFDSLSYTLSDGSTYQDNLYIDDLFLNEPNTPPFSGNETVTPGQTVSVTGLSIEKAPTVVNGVTTTSDPDLTVTLSVVDLNYNVSDGTLGFSSAAVAGSTITDVSSNGISSFVISGTESEINQDLNALTYTGGNAGTDTFEYSASDGSFSTGTYYIGAFTVAGTTGPLPVISDTYDSEISLNLYGTGGSIDGTEANNGNGVNVIGISTDGVNFTPIGPGESATVNGTYENFTADYRGDGSDSVIQSDQSIINAINANDLTGSGPLTDTFYYEVSDGTDTQIDEFTFTYGDVSVSTPNGISYGQTEHVDQGAVLSLSGISVMKALSTDSNGDPIPSDPELTINISAFDYATQQYDGTFAVNTAVAGGGGVVTVSAGDISITGLESQINADLATLTFTDATAGDDPNINIYTVDHSYVNDPAGYQSATYVYGNIDVACYVAGTRIATAAGEVAVEDLNIGDELKTLHAGLQKIKWIGTRGYAAPFANHASVLPICISAGAIADNVPSRDLWVSPGHAICIDGVLIHAQRLINGVSVLQAERVESVTYYHIELETHEVIFAENCPAETFMDEAFRRQFHNAAEYAALYPGQQAPGLMCLPRLDDGFALEAIRRRLAARAGIREGGKAGPLRGFVDQVGEGVCTGWAQDLANPEVPVCLDVFVDGIRVARVLANHYRADLRDAGMGSGCHGFRALLPAGVEGRLDVRRAGDGCALSLTEAAFAWAA